MAYQVLARKWRPKIFQDIIGQEHITQTLQNAILSNRVGHAYLFTGLRGIGKTSAARVLAKAIRCENSQNANPCNTCKNCEEITDGKSVDVLEIDGASNNSVEDIRGIRNAAGYLPASGKMKIYIIDEVHMLSTSAFNALLKTLEEPPAHVLFIFATTEVQKIPATILSRCQRFDFKRASNSQIVERLESIAKAENITLERGALQLISRESEGSVRDALSLLDQVIAFSSPASATSENEESTSEDPGNFISVHQAAKALGIVDRSLVLNTLKAIVERKPVDAVKQVEGVYRFGFDLKQFSREIYEALRALTLVKVSGSDVKEFLELPENEIEEMSELSKNITTETLQLLFKTFHENITLTLKGMNPRVSLEMLLIRLATLEPVESIQNIIESMKALANGRGPTQSAPLNSREQAIQPRATNSAQNEEKKTPFSRTLSQINAPDGSQNSTAGAPQRFRIPQSQPKSQISESKPQPPKKSVTKAVIGAERNWEGFMRWLKKTNPGIGFTLESGNLVKPIDTNAEKILLEIAFPESEAFSRDNLLGKQKEFRKIAQEFFAPQKTDIKILNAEEVSQLKNFKSIAELEKIKNQNAMEKVKNDLVNHPVVKTAEKLFGAEISKIELNNKNE